MRDFGMRNSIRPTTSRDTIRDVIRHEQSVCSNTNAVAVKVKRIFHFSIVGGLLLFVTNGALNVLTTDLENLWRGYGKRECHYFAHRYLS
jgi:hypothetical protein